MADYEEFKKDVERRLKNIEKKVDSIRPPATIRDSGLQEQLSLLELRVKAVIELLKVRLSGFDEESLEKVYTAVKKKEADDVNLAVDYLDGLMGPR
jgi:hypothetical protein